MEDKLNVKVGNAVGAGSFGNVYRALDLKYGSLCALKKIPVPNLSPEDELEYKNELDILMKLDHPNISKCYRIAKSSSEVWILLEYADGGSLESLILTYGKLPENLVANYLTQIIHGLVYLHEKKVIHRDIKPSNILMTSQGQVKISDFGCSQQMLTSQTPLQLVTQMKGSVPYMAPEALRQEVLSRKADIWSLGCLALELATGKDPWAHKQWDNLFSAMLYIGKRNVTPPICDSLSSGMKEFLGKCFQRDLKKRASAKTLLGDPWLCKHGMGDENRFKDPS